VKAINTSGRAVLFAGLTVAIALLGQFAIGLSFLDGAAVAATVTVVATMLASLTLLPSLLGFIGPRVLSRKQRRRIRESGPQADAAASGMWHRWSRSIERRSALRALVALAVVVVVALPVFSLRLGLDDAGTDPTSSLTRQGYDLLAQGFGPGFNGPLELVATLHGPADQAAFAHVVNAASGQPGVVAVTSPKVNPSGHAAVAVLYPTSAPQAAPSRLRPANHPTGPAPARPAGASMREPVARLTAAMTNRYTRMTSRPEKARAL